MSDGLIMRIADYAFMNVLLGATIFRKQAAIAAIVGVCAGVGVAEHRYQEAVERTKPIEYVVTAQDVSNIIYQCNSNSNNLESVLKVYAPK